VEITALPHYEFQEEKFKEQVAFPLRKHAVCQSSKLLSWVLLDCAAACFLELMTGMICSFAYAYQIIGIQNHWLLLEGTEQQHIPVLELN